LLSKHSLVLPNIFTTENVYFVLTEPLVTSFTLASNTYMLHKVSQQMLFYGWRYYTKWAYFASKDVTFFCNLCYKKT